MVQAQRRCSGALARLRRDHGAFLVHLRVGISADSCGVSFPRSPKVSGARLFVVFMLADVVHRLKRLLLITRLSWRRRKRTSSRI